MRRRWLALVLVAFAGAGGTPELRYANALTVPPADDQLLTRILRIKAALIRPNDEPVVWIWLVVAGALCALMAAAAVFVWRRRPTPSIVS